MNCCFYEAIDRLPLATVAAIEFLPVIALAAIGARTARNAAALTIAVPGVYLLTGIQFATEPAGLAFAFANAALFAGYIVIAHRFASDAATTAITGIDGLAAAMLIAADRRDADRRPQVIPAVTDPLALLAGVGRRDLLIGDPVRDRPARDGAPAEGHLLADRLAAAGDRDRSSA